jgi:hypothetical protein
MAPKHCRCPPSEDLRSLWPHVLCTPLVGWASESGAQVVSPEGGGVGTVARGPILQASLCSRPRTSRVRAFAAERDPG